jgi:hypothetical protein
MSIQERVDNILIELTIISMLQPQERMCIRDGKLAIEPKKAQIITSIKRWWNVDSRVNTIERIKTVFKNTI